MLRLLIVDDEEIITDGLYEVFRMRMPDRLDVCKAYSGKEALEWLKRTRFDIVMTDISMPGMSGLELSEEIQLYWPRCRIVFLTGYSEFDYAYKAIQMPRARYLLKTEGFGKVIEVIEEVVAEVDESSQIGSLVELSREQLYALEVMEQAEFIRHLLQDSGTHASDREAFAAELRKAGLKLDPQQQVYVVAGQLAYPDDSGYSVRSGLLRTAERIWDSFLAEQSRRAGIVEKQGELVWLLQPAVPLERQFDGYFARYLEGMLELIQEACQKQLGLTAAFALGGSPSEWRSVTPQAARLRQLLQVKLSGRMAAVLIDRFEPDEADGGKDDLKLPQRTELLAAHLEAGRRELFFEAFHELADGLLDAQIQVERAVEGYYSVALLLHAAIQRWGLGRDIGDCRKLLRLDEHASMKEAAAYLRELAGRLFELKHRSEIARASSVIDRICRYIETHLEEDLSLVRLAEINYFNPSYLSRFFKQESGMNLSEYIDGCRLKKAKELLRNGELKIREVAGSVGYEAAHSFTRFFKKSTGLTPQEYRDSLQAR
ncbi:helix-turn-helix domain-containing protein [Paenibacillus sp. FSL W8-1187]|uniref:DNA-binding response regulator, AraC family n=1 Tax=Paenibacillus pasadenensis TaxID=217090 RepID=A0A2N5N6B8_9BACL|nr:helix-turn-helix domain-containing protein [Paenibacillus pasadenensis]PLT45872.1 DNA-binding response regulator, AraC family [Paenibacillus pasadenensis]